MPRGTDFREIVARRGFDEAGQSRVRIHGNTNAPRIGRIRVQYGHERLTEAIDNDGGFHTSLSQARARKGIWSERLSRGVDGCCVLEVADRD